MTTEVTEPLDLNELVKPLVETIATLDDDIVLLETTLRLKREQRQRYRGVLRGIDPERVRPLYSQKNGAGKKKGKNEIGTEYMARITSYLQVNKEMLNGLNEGEGVYSSQIVRLEGFPLQGDNQQSRAAKAMKTLQEQGILRLGRVGGMGGRKYYKVV